MVGGIVLIMMMQWRKDFRILACSLSVLSGSILAACSTSYKVQHVDPATIDAQSADAGIYYYLPKTRIIIEAVATGTRKEYGSFSNSKDKLMGGPVPDYHGGKIYTYAELLAYNREQCDKAANPIALTEAQRYENHAKPDGEKHNYSISDFTTTTQTIADTQHLYRVDVDPSALSSFSHKITLDENGIISAATTTVSDAVSPFIFNSVKSFASLAGGAGGVSGKTYCKILDDTTEAIKQINTEITAKMSSRLDVLKSARPDVDIKIYELHLKQIDADITELKKSLAETKSVFGNKTHKKTFVIIGEIEPDPGNSTSYDWAVYEPKYEKKDDDQTPKRISFLPGEASTALNRVQQGIDKSLQDKINSLSVRINGRALVKTKTGVMVEPKTNFPNTQEKGYKIRVPYPTKMVISDANGQVASSNVQLAQYGAIATLPSKFFGSKGTIDLAFNSKTGGLSVVTIGADPISSTAVSQYVDVYKEYKTNANAVEEAKEAAEKSDAAALAAATAAENRADIDAILIEIERLEALKKLRDLRIELGLPVE